MASHELEITSAGAIEHLLVHRPAQIRKLIVGGRGPRRENILELARRAGVAVEEKNQEGLRALLNPYPYADLDRWLSELPAKALVVVLDHLEDPQNFGAICRTAEALGVNGAIIPKDRSVEVTAGVYHASVGGVANLPIVKVTNLSATIKRLRDEGFWIVGTALGEKSTAPAQVPDFDRVALVLGSEYSGMSEKLVDKCDWQVNVPLVGTVPSLNVSAAAAILLFEFSKRLSVPPSAPPQQ
ncbi:MAG: 23S rRNA (guanosine(2251)-2'-O)-methyltransferase RlmB [Bdellovibrionaceae bacterium]|nr:23S rRNA (guanosine(2251)-2'-O)-methyltransferase RlmB [Bdellovibrionales bacterium]MCB9255012.1 23S rRNA (guanosine(2251)-2'-O)-methyltransferase RlmB [Pseudobdellovibrionaceae bacterium]